MDMSSVMDAIWGVKDAASLDPELLQLQEVSQSALKEKPQIAKELYCQWLSLQETGTLVRSFIEDAKAGSLLDIHGNSNSTNSSSPRNLSGSPSFTKHGLMAGPASLVSPFKVVTEPSREAIPQFYFQSGRPPPRELIEDCLSRIDTLFSVNVGGLGNQEFKSVTIEICKLPSFFSTSLFRKIDVDDTGIVTRDAFVDFWVNSNMMAKDIATQIFVILKQPHCNYLTQEDFKMVLQELLATHPGLEFLQYTPEFQEIYGYPTYISARLLVTRQDVETMTAVFFLAIKYVLRANAETVIYTIFYYLNRSGNDHLTLRELKRGNLIAAMRQADEVVDISKVFRYFSYEHYYVLYCAFWELDTDHDLLIDKENLMRYGNHALTYRIVDRIFSQVPRKFKSNVEGKMNYEDFIYFMLSEEDKSSEPSLEYWFKCIDLDGNGILSFDEIWFFYEEQFQRMKCRTQEPVLFQDIVCQMIDMIRPQKNCYFTFQDLKVSKFAGDFFNVLFNINKFMAFEYRDPSLIRQEEEEDPTLTEWHRFAHREYIRLSMEEWQDSLNERGDTEDVPNGSGDLPEYEWTEPNISYG